MNLLKVLLVIVSFTVSSTTMAEQIEVTPKGTQHPNSMAVDEGLMGSETSDGGDLSGKFTIQMACLCAVAVGDPTNPSDDSFIDWVMVEQKNVGPDKVEACLGHNFENISSVCTLPFVNATRECSDLASAANDNAPGSFMNNFMVNPMTCVIGVRSADSPWDSE
jgi:hypothetical protein